MFGDIGRTLKKEIKKGIKKVKRIGLGIKADSKTDKQDREEIKRIKKRGDDRSDYRERVADLYEHLVDFLEKLCDYDRKNFNVAAINRALKKEGSKKGEIDARTKKEASSVSKSLYDEHVRMINVKSIKVVKNKEEKTTTTSTVATVPIKLNFRNYFDMNGKPSKELSYTYDFLRGMEPDVAVRKTVKLYAVCCIYMERMEQKIRLFFTNHKKFKQLEAYYKRMDEKLLKLTNEERRIIKGFSKNVYNELTGENEVRELSAEKNKKEGRDDRIDFEDGYTSDFLRKIQEIKDFVGENAPIIDGRRYSRVCLRGLRRLENMYKNSTRKLESSFEVMADGGKQKDAERLKEQVGYPSLIANIDKKFEELKILYNRVSESELALRIELKKLDDKEKLRIYKKRIEKEFVLEKKGPEETNQDYEKRFMLVDRQRAKECVELIESLSSMQKVIEDYDLKFGRKKRFLLDLLRELEALEDKPVFKNTIKESMSGLVLGRGRTAQFKHNLNKKMKGEKEKWDKEDERLEKEGEDRVTEIDEAGKGAIEGYEKEIQEEKAKEMAERKRKLEEKAAAEKAAAEKAAAEEEKKRKEAAGSPSDESIPVEESPDPSADLSGGSASAPRKPLPAK